MEIDIEEPQNAREGTSLVLDLTKAILIRWDNAITSITKNNYYEVVGKSKSLRPQTTNAIYSLYLTIRNSFCSDRKLNPKEIDIIFSNKDFDRVMEVYADMDSWLYEKGITKFDIKKVYDRSRVEHSNKVKGL